MITNPDTLIVNNAHLAITSAEAVGVAIAIDHVETPIVILPETFTEALRPQREIGDQVNSFMLCVLISKSAKRIKVRAENMGVSLPLSIITRSIQRAYQLAAKDENGPFVDSRPNLAKLMKLNDKILRDEIKRQTQIIVKK